MKEKRTPKENKEERCVKIAQLVIMSSALKGRKLSFSHGRKSIKESLFKNKRYMLLNRIFPKEPVLRKSCLE
jgi:hypothetical protein